MSTATIKETVETNTTQEPQSTTPLETSLENPTSTSTPTETLENSQLTPQEEPSSKSTALEEATKGTTQQIEAEEEYELELADESPLSQEDLDAIAQFASDNKLSKVQAEALIKDKETLFNKGKETATISQTEKINKMAESFNNDPDFVGDNRASSFESIKRVVQAFDTDGTLFEALKDPAIGHSLPLAKFLKRLGDTMKDDTFEGRGGSTGAKPEMGTYELRAQNMYPDLFK